MNAVRTLAGDIKPEQLGFTLMHEHLLCSDWVKRMCVSGYFRREEALEIICPVVERAVACGVNTIVDVTPLNLGRDIEILAEVSRRTGVNIVACTGLYATEDKWLDRISEEGLLFVYKKDIEEGMQGTAIRAGAIKCATDALGFTPLNEKMLRVAARAQRDLGLPLITHCRPPGQEQGLRQIEIFESEGANLKRVLIGHFRNGDSLDYARKVLKRGCFIGIDQMNFQERNLEHNIRVIKTLLDEGWIGQLIFSHDAVVCYNYEHMGFASPRQYADFAPNMLSYLKETGQGKMVAAGIPEEALHTVFYDNPRRLFGDDLS